MCWYTEACRLNPSASVMFRSKMVGCRWSEVHISIRCSALQALPPSHNGGSICSCRLLQIWCHSAGWSQCYCTISMADKMATASLDWQHTHAEYKVWCTHTPMLRSVKGVLITAASLHWRNVPVHVIRYPCTRIVMYRKRFGELCLVSITNFSSFHKSSFF